MTRGLAVLLLWSSAAYADPIVLRMATPAPDGTEWAREGRSQERDIEELTHGQVRIKWILGGVAGDELQMLERVKKEQIDGVVSGGMACQKLAPTMRALRLVGVFQNRDESAFVSGRLKDSLDAEFLKAGFINLGEVGVGPDVILSRQPVASMADLRKARLWVWDLDDLYRKSLDAMGVSIVARPLESAGADYEKGTLDGFLAVPTAALAFQWSAEARYYTDLRPSFLRGCYLLASRAYDQLSVEQQRAMRQSSARTIQRLEDIGRRQDEALLGGLFARQGMKKVPVSESFRAEFFQLAQQARDTLGDKLVPRALITRVLGLLADYRAMHRAVETER